MKKYMLKIPIGELFSFLKLKNEINIPVKANRNVKILTPNNKFVEIVEFIKKKGNVSSFKLFDGTKIICDENHLIKQSDGKFIFIKDAVYLLKNNIEIKIISKEELGYREVFDISIPFPHEYVTASGIISHNSSAGNLLIKEIDCDFKYINAANESGIETVRTIIMQFCTSTGFAPLKVLFLDEFSEFSPAGQMALRAVMEQFSKHTRFILTCNSVERIIEPIRSRSQEFKILPPTKEEVFTRCEYILQKEEVEYDRMELQYTIDFGYPDIRKCIQLLQQQTTEKVLRLNKDFFKLLKYQEDVVKIFKTIKEDNLFDKVTEIRQILAASKVKNYTQLYRHLYDKLDDYTIKEKRVRVICHLQEGLKYDSFIADKEINIVSTLLRIAEEIIR